jgi:hypothetical protein
MADNPEIFDGKTFQDLTKDIYDNVKNKEQQLNSLVMEIHTFVRTIDDAVLIAPIIKEIMDVSIKNDEHLVKLASVLQRIITKSMGETDADSVTLTDDEKEELIRALEDTATEAQQSLDKITKIETKKKTFLGN